MLKEYQEEINELQAINPHFAKILEKHRELDAKAKDVDEGRLHMDQFELDQIKKEKLKLKDEALKMILIHQKEKEEAK